MEIRAANSVEAPQLVDILVERHADSRYAEVCGVDEVIARKILAHAIHRHGGTNEGATFVNVAVDEDGAICAFIFGILNRIYGIGDRLASCDNYLIGREGVSAFVLDQLFARYVTWAMDNPKVAEIGGSWANSIDGAERFGPMLERRGFSKMAETWTIMADEARDEEVAA